MQNWSLLFIFDFSLIYDVSPLTEYDFPLSSTYPAIKKMFANL